MLADPCLHNDAFFFLKKSFFTNGTTTSGVSVMTRRGGKGLCLLYSQSLECAGRAKCQEASPPVIFAHASVGTPVVWNSTRC